MLFRSEVSLKENFQLTAACAPFTTVAHSITRYRITQRVFRVRLTARPKVMKENLQWLDLAALSHLPFTSAHKRILTRLAAMSLPQLPVSAGARADRSSS